MFKKLVLALTCAGFVGSTVFAHNSAEIDAAIEKAKNKEMCEKAENLAYKLRNRADCLAALNCTVALLATTASIINYKETGKWHVGVALLALYSIYNTCQSSTITNKVSKLRAYVSTLKYSLIDRA